MEHVFPLSGIVMMMNTGTSRLPGAYINGPVLSINHSTMAESSLSQEDLLVLELVGGFLIQITVGLVVETVLYSRWPLVFLQSVNVNVEPSAALYGVCIFHAGKILL